MSDANMLLLALQAVVRAAKDRHAPPAVPEPEFVPFRLSSRRGAAPARAQVEADEVLAANSARHPRTLQELGVPATLAADIESTLRWMGKVQGDRIVGYTYQTPDGAVHPLRVDRPDRDASSDRAA